MHVSILAETALGVWGGRWFSPSLLPIDFRRCLGENMFDLSARLFALRNVGRVLLSGTSHVRRIVTCSVKHDATDA